MTSATGSAYVPSGPRSAAPTAWGDDDRGGPARLPPADPVFGTPTAAELLGAVGDFLRADLLPSTTGQARYLLRVAVNVIDIVRRECEQRDRAGTVLRQALAELGMADEGELARAIRSGAFDDRAEEVRRYLTTAALTRLAVDNPSYPPPTTFPLVS